MVNFQTEKQTAEGAMVRQMAGEVRDSIMEEISDLYRDDEGKLEGYRKSCADWHWKVVLYIPRNKRDMYINYIIVAFGNKHNLDDDKIWRMLMKRNLPSNAVDKIWYGSFTQVPKLSIYNQAPLKRKKWDGELGIIAKE